MHKRREMDHELPSHSDVQEEILSYLRKHPSARTDSFAAGRGVPLDLGIGRPFREGMQGLAVDGITLAPTLRRLGHLLAPSALSSGVPATYFADRGAVQEANDRGDDPVLYRAYRDVLPPRNKKLNGHRMFAPAGRADAADGTSCWYADLVVYSPGLLPGREPHRSTGHWNSDAQLEIFQTLSGKVLVLTGTPSGEGQTCVTYQICRSGDISVIPFGGWHLTYCLDGPAAVFNIYTDISSLSSGVVHSSRDAALNERVKYAARVPVEVAVAVDSEAMRFIVGNAHTTLSGETATPSWIRSYVNETVDLCSLYLYGTSELIEGLEETAGRANDASWGRNAR
jgi:hypothetical protein